MVECWSLNCYSFCFWYRNIKLYLRTQPLFWDTCLENIVQPLCTYCFYKTQPWSGKTTTKRKTTICHLHFWEILYSYFVLFFITMCVPWETNQWPWRDKHSTELHVVYIEKSLCTVFIEPVDILDLMNDLLQNIKRSCTFHFEIHNHKHEQESDHRKQSYFLQ